MQRRASIVRGPTNAFVGHTSRQSVQLPQRRSMGASGSSAALVRWSRGTRASRDRDDDAAVLADEAHARPLGPGLLDGAAVDRVASLEASLAQKRPMPEPLGEDVVVVASQRAGDLPGRRSSAPPRLEYEVANTKTLFAEGSILHGGSARTRRFRRASPSRPGVLLDELAQLFPSGSRACTSHPKP